jgi:hypothetical protein
MEPLGEVVTEADAVEVRGRTFGPRCPRLIIVLSQSKQEDKIEEAPKPIVVA